MKRKVFIMMLVIICLIASISSPAFCQDYCKKLGRGFINTITGWLEIPKQIFIESHETNIFYGLTRGVAKGFGNAFSRTGIGVYEVFTFPFPGSEEYEKITDPEFVFNTDSSADPY